MNIKSRYSIVDISDDDLVGKKSGSLEQGYVWAPYIPMTTTQVINDDNGMFDSLIRKRKQEDRENKLKELLDDTDGNTKS